MARDLVCGRTVDEETAEIISEYNGKKYYFCTDLCKRRFDINPTVFTMRSIEPVRRGGCCG